MFRLLDGVDEILDVDAGAALGVCLVHGVGGAGGEVADDVDPRLFRIGFNWETRRAAQVALDVGGDVDAEVKARRLGRWATASTGFSR